MSKIYNLVLINLIVVVLVLTVFVLPVQTGIHIVVWLLLLEHWLVLICL